MSPLALLPVAAAVEPTEGEIRYPGAPPAWVAVLVLVALVFLVRWIYRRERQKVSRPWRVVLGGLRILAVLLVALALFRPEREISQTVYDKSHLVVLLDTSSSMATRDRYTEHDQASILSAAFPDDGPDPRPRSLSLSRLEITQRILAQSPDALLRSLAERFVLHVYAFDEDVRLLATTEPRSGEAGAAEGEKDAAAAGPARGADADAIAKAIRGAKAEGTQTAIGGALRAIAREFVGRDDRRLAGVVLVSDGRDNSTERPSEAVAALGKGAEDLRVSAVALGDPHLAKNAWVDRITAKDEILMQDTATFAVQIRQKGFDPGFEGAKVSLEIWQIGGPDGKPFPKPVKYVPKRETAQDMTTATVRVLESNKPTLATLRALFADAGSFDVKVRLTLPDARAAEDAVAEDNERVHHLFVRDQTIKVLLVDREMRYETHFLKNVLTRESRHKDDPRRVDAQTWIQLFHPDVVQPHGKAVPALKAFPSTRQEIFGYDVIIIGDIDWRHLGATDERSKEILTLLREFVAEGGGIAFIAGEAANPRSFTDTPLGDLVPVVVGTSDGANDIDRTTPFRIAPTEEGRANPILSVLQDRPEKVDEIWREHDGWEWYWLYRAKGGLKPGASALARVWSPPSPQYLDERGDPCVVFAKSEFGKGRVFFSAIDQISRIRMSFADVYYGAFWDEAIRWLATYRLQGGNRRYKIETDKESYFVGETATIRVFALDSDFKPLTEPKLRGLQVDGPDGKPMLGEADAATHGDTETEPGLYRTYLRLPTTGTYRIYVDPPERDGGSRAEHPIEAKFATLEDQDKVPDHDTLKSIVERANPPQQPGRVYAPWQLPELVRSIPSLSTPRKIDPHDEPLWDNPWILIIVTAVLALEWILRKRFQMI